MIILVLLPELDAQCLDRFELELLIPATFQRVRSTESGRRLLQRCLVGFPIVGILALHRTQEVRPDHPLKCVSYSSGRGP